MTDDVFVRRARLAACWLVLTAVAFIQQPGRIVSDTKLDLVVDPGRFLGRATSLWDPIGYFGQVQNQAYGYFVPMGSFFWGGAALRIEPWIVQRLWWSLVLIVAFTGFVLLARELRIGAPWAHLVGGFAFALSPRMLTVIGPSSIEVWPMAVAPWVLLALVVGTSRRSPVAMAAASAVAVACVGGVNAAATFAVIPLGAMWLAMAPAGPRRRRMMLAWPGFVLLGTLWWLVPLVLLGRYSPPFLDFIESASLTSFDTTLLDTLRGTSNWTSYLSTTSVAGRNLVSEPILLLNLAVVLALSVAGLARRDLPHRRFLFVAMLGGLVLVTMGHTASHGGLGAPQLQSLLDGALSPLRNTHKFDVVVRVPLVLAFVHVLTVSAHQFSVSGAVEAGRRIAPTLGVAVLGVVAVAGAASPAWTAQLAPRGSVLSIPDYWKQTATWLATQDPHERALVVPASAFGSYLWGYTNDDVLQPLATTPWGVRNAIPLAPPGNIRMLDAVERELTDGRGSEALRQYLLDSGISLLVVRNDLTPTSDGLDPEVVHRALSDMRGVSLVRSFGPSVGGEATIGAGGTRTFIDQGWQAKHDAVEVYRVGRRPPARAQPASEVPVVVGGADSQVGLLASGLVTSPSVVFADDLPRSRDVSSYVLTDGQRRQEVAFGRVHDNRSASLGVDEAYTADRPVHDYSGSKDDRWSTVPRLMGARSITASSSESSVGTPDRIDLAAQPWSAFDGDALTSWRAAPTDIGRRSWIRITFDEPTDVSDVTVTVAGDSLDATQIAARTDQDSSTAQARHGVPRSFDGLDRPARFLEISAPSVVGDVLAITDVDVPGIQLSRPLQVPSAPATWGAPTAVMLQASAGYRSGCLPINGRIRCAAGQDTWGEDGRVIDRVVTLPSGGTYPLGLTVEPIGGAALDAVMQDNRLVTIAATSQVVRSAQASALAAVDGDEKTAWVAGVDDSRPTLTVSWVGERPVSRLTVRLDDDTAASRPTAALLRFPDGSRREVTFSARGEASFDPVTTQRVEIELTDFDPVRNLDSTGGGQVLPIGVSELRLGGTGLLPVSTDTTVRTLPCGSGPSISVDGRIVQTRLVTSAETLRTGRQLQATVCGEATIGLTAGDHRITVAGTDAVRPVRLALGASARPSGSTTVDTGTWGATRRQLTVDGASDQLLTVTENTNPGWQAAAEGAEPVVVNGWQQGWRLPPDADDAVTLSYAPNGLYRAGLVVGGVLLLSLLVIGLVLARRAGPGGPAAKARSFRRRDGVLAAVVLVGAGLVLGGVVGLVSAAAAYGVTNLARRRVDPAVLAGALVAVVALASTVRPWGGASPWLGSMDWPQVMIAVACGVVASSVFGLPSRRRRSTGVSTKA